MEEQRTRRQDSAPPKVPEKCSEKACQSKPLYWVVVVIGSRLPWREPWRKRIGLVFCQPCADKAAADNFVGKLVAREGAAFKRLARQQHLDVRKASLELEAMAVTVTRGPRGEVVLAPDSGATPDSADSPK